MTATRFVDYGALTEDQKRVYALQMREATLESVLFKRFYVTPSALPWWRRRLNRIQGFWRTNVVGAWRVLTGKAYAE